MFHNKKCQDYEQVFSTKMIFEEGNISSPSPAANNEDLNLKKYI